MLGQPLADAGGPEVAQHGPELERPEAPAELHAGIHQVPHAPGLGRRQVVGRQRERGANRVHAARVERAQIERGEEPLVRVDDDRVRAPAVVHDPGGLRDQGGGAGVRGVDVQPDPLGRAHVGDLRHRIHAGHGGRADRGDDRQRRPAGRAVGRHGRAQRVGPHAEPVVDGDPLQGALPEPQRHHGLVDRRVRMLGQVDPARRQLGASRQPAGADVRDGRLAGRGQRVQARHRGRVVDHPLERGRQPQQLPQPAQGDFLQLGRGGRGAPQHRLHVEGRGQQLRQHARPAPGDGEVGEEAGVVPVGDAGQEMTLEVREDRVERRARLRRGGGQPLADLAGRGARQDRVAVVLAQVGGDPVDEGVSVAPEFLRPHVAERARAISRHPGRSRVRTPSAPGCAARSARPRRAPRRGSSRPAARA